MTDHSKPYGWYCATCAKEPGNDGMILVANCIDPETLASARGVTCTCKTECIPCFTPLAAPEPSVIHDMAELEVVTVPSMGAWDDAWFMSSDANRGDIGDRRASALVASACWYSESDIPRIAETSARLREEDQ